MYNFFLDSIDQIAKFDPFIRMHPKATPNAYAVCFVMLLLSTAGSRAADAAANDDAGYYPFTFSAYDGAKTFVHAGRQLLHPPAGRFGFVTSDEAGHFVFGATGAKARFWGVNVSYDVNFPAHAQADMLAARMAKLGINIVRFHWYDASPAPNGIWKDDHLEAFDPEQVDRMDYFIAQLKRHGIYVNMNLLTGWKMNRTSRIRSTIWPERSRYIIHFHPAAQQLLKQFAADVLGHVNPYLEKSLADDPALAMVEMINENNFQGGWFQGSFNLHGGGKSKFRIARDDLAILYERWHAYLRKQYGSTEQLRQAWGKSGRALLTGESLEDRNINLLDGRAIKQVSVQRIRDTLAFVQDVESGFYRDFVAYLKRDVGVRCPISGVHHLGIGATSLYSRRALDYIDTHGYWNHPKNAGFGLGRDKPKLVPNDSLLSKVLQLSGYASGAQSPILRYSRNRIAEKPFTVSEWNLGYPGEYLYELVLMEAAYASFQDWGGMMYFTFAHNLDQFAAGGGLMESFAMQRNTVDQLLFPVGAYMYLRGDVAVADRTVRAQHPIGRLYRDAVEAFMRSDTELSYGGARIDGQRIPDWIPLVHGVARTFEDASDDAGAPVPVLDKENVFPSDTGELLMDVSDPAAAYYRIETPKSQAVVGFLSRHASLRLSVLEVASKTNAAIALVSKDNRPLRVSKSAMLVAVSGMKYTEQKLEDGVIRHAGREPCLLQRVHATITIHSDSLAKAAVYALDPTGERVKQCTVDRSDGLLRFDVGKADSPWFELSVE